MGIDQLYLWCVSAISLLVAGNTCWRLWTERARLAKDDLNDDDRAFAWRIVLFIVFPLINLLDMRATCIACEMLGGYIKSSAYGLLWYHAVPAGLASPSLLIPVVFAGSLTTTLFALCLLPSLFFRPHPFLATVIGYSITFTFGLNLIADPLLSLTGLGALRWQVALSKGFAPQMVPIIATHIAAAIVFILIMRSTTVRLWFSSLTRPQAAARLHEMLSTSRVLPPTAHMSCATALLFEQAGLRPQASRHLQRMQMLYPLSPYTHFLQAVISYRRRSYEKARKSFVHASDYPGIDGELKASLLAASACSAFAQNDVIGALNLSERALEFDHTCVMARLIKVDVFLRQQKKEQAGEEILNALKQGLDLNLEGNVPLDVERSFDMLSELQERKPIRNILQSSDRITS